MTQRRPSISAAVKVSVAIRQANVNAPRGFICPLCDDELLSWDARVLEHLVPRATRIALGLDPDEVENLRWVHKACADRKTNGSKATCADGDIHKIAKAKRLAKARQAHDAIVKREAEKVAGSIKSRGFETKYRKKMNGEVVPRG